MITLVLDPLIVSDVEDNATYVEFCDLLKQVAHAGILVVDSKRDTLRHIRESMLSAPPKYRQRMELIFEKILMAKDLTGVNRVIVHDQYPAPIISEDLWQWKAADRVEILRDFVVYGPFTDQMNPPGTPNAIGLEHWHNDEALKPEGTFKVSHTFAEGENATALQTHLRRALGLTSFLEIYDPILFRGGDHFRRSLIALIRWWHEASSEMSFAQPAKINLYTAEERSNTDSSRFESLLGDLRAEFSGLNLFGHVKEVSGYAWHQRFLRTQYAAFQFEPGFDFLAQAGKLRRCPVDQQDKELNQFAAQIRRLPDA